METHVRTPSPTDGSDDEGALVAPDLPLMRADAPQRVHEPREVFNARRWVGRAGADAADQPPALGSGLSADPQRWFAAECFETMTPGLRVLLRGMHGRPDALSTVILDSRTLQRAPESGARAGGDGQNKRTGGKLPVALGPLGQLLALHVTAADAQDRAHGGALSEAAPGVHLVVVKLPEARRGFVRWPRRWVGERRFAGTSRFRRLARDDERWPETVAGLHFVAFACLLRHRMLPRAVHRP